jgi:hypothetical protein
VLPAAGGARYQARRLGVTMHLPDIDGDHYPESYVIDDWRYHRETFT